MDENLKAKFNNLMYAFNKMAARESFVDFLEFRDVTEDEWEAIKAHLFATYGTKFYC